MLYDSWSIVTFIITLFKPLTAIMRSALLSLHYGGENWDLTKFWKSPLFWLHGRISFLVKVELAEVSVLHIIVTPSKPLSCLLSISTSRWFENYPFTFTCLQGECEVSLPRFRNVSMVAGTVSGIDTGRMWGTRTTGPCKEKRGRSDVTRVKISPVIIWFCLWAKASQGWGSCTFFLLWDVSTLKS